jgi:hypothetical protein
VIVVVAAAAAAEDPWHMLGMVAELVKDDGSELEIRWRLDHRGEDPEVAAHQTGWDCRVRRVSGEYTREHRGWVEGLAALPPPLRPVQRSGCAAVTQNNKRLVSALRVGATRLSLLPGGPTGPRPRRLSARATQAPRWSC